jgi:hypothetical protein
MKHVGISNSPWPIDNNSALLIPKENCYDPPDPSYHRLASYGFTPILHQINPRFARACAGSRANHRDPDMRGVSAKPCGDDLGWGAIRKGAALPHGPG